LIHGSLDDSLDIVQQPKGRKECIMHCTNTFGINRGGIDKATGHIDSCMTSHEKLPIDGQISLPDGDQVIDGLDGGK